MRYFAKKIYYLINFIFYTIKFSKSKLYFPSIFKKSIFGTNVIVSSNCEIVNTTIDNFSYVSKNTIILYSDIGKFCSIASGVKINLPNHPINFISTHPIFYSRIYKKFNKIEISKYNESNRVTIGNDVWIGENSIILTGVKIGNGAVIASGAIVNKDVPDYAVVGGVPAKLIKYRFTKEEISLLLTNKWWNSSLNIILSNLDKFTSTKLFFEKQ
jgi:acetyltransferase-like isoleucine patch superfamily enzyme